MDFEDDQEEFGLREGTCNEKVPQQTTSLPSTTLSTNLLDLINKARSDPDWFVKLL